MGMSKLDLDTDPLSAFLALDFVLAFLGVRTRGVGLEVRHPPGTAVTCSGAVACLVFVKPFDQMIAGSNVESAGGMGLEDVGEEDGMGNGGGKGSRTPDLLNAIQTLSQTELYPHIGPLYQTELCRHTRWSELSTGLLAINGGNIGEGREPVNGAN
jgi:hypothetical protein